MKKKKEKRREGKGKRKKEEKIPFFKIEDNEFFCFFQNVKIYLTYLYQRYR